MSWRRRLDRLIRVTEQRTVLYRAQKNAPRRFPTLAGPDLFGGPARNFQLFDPLDFSRVFQPPFTPGTPAPVDWGG